MNPIIVSSFCVYPEIKSSEGIVNKNWIDIINSHKENCFVLSATNSLKIVEFKNLYILKTREDWFLKLMYKASKENRSFIGIIYSILNRILLKLGILENGINLNQLIWSSRQKTVLSNILKLNKDYVFWARILPTFSISPLLEVWKVKKFPIIVNINDPIADSEIEEKLLLNTSDKAQCWTFPSNRLAIKMANKYELDLQRCFVIPHAMREQKTLYLGHKSSSEKIKILYTGTFYKSAFTAAFMNQLKDFCHTKEYDNVEFTFILSQYDNNSLNWLKDSIPDVNIFIKLDREKVLEIAKKADCMLVIDGLIHQDLLKGKLIEAISLGLPVFSIGYQESVMDKVVMEYGGFSAYQNIENDITNKLIQAVNDLGNFNWRIHFLVKRKDVMDKISEQSIMDRTNKVSAYAYQRFLWQEGMQEVEPIPPLNLNWP